GSSVSLGLGGSILLALSAFLQSSPHTSTLILARRLRVARLGRLSLRFLFTSAWIDAIRSRMASSPGDLPDDGLPTAETQTIGGSAQPSHGEAQRAVASNTPAPPHHPA